MIDSRDLKELHPCLERAANRLISLLKKEGYNAGISSTYRDNEMQNSLYAKGRTVPGQIVTNAKGGSSIHNYRLAFDIFKNVKGQEWSDNTFFEVAGRLGMEMGLTWGGSWKTFVDKPHFEFTNGLSLSDLQKGKAVPMDAKMLWETKLPEGFISLEVNGVSQIIAAENRDGSNFVKFNDIAVRVRELNELKEILLVPEQKVPLRKILELLGYTVGWRQETSTVVVDKI